ncbi:Nudix hydrolase 3 [Sarracenia purpurea var. burkii]
MRTSPEGREFLSVAEQSSSFGLNRGVAIDRCFQICSSKPPILMCQNLDKQGSSKRVPFISWTAAFEAIWTIKKMLGGDASGNLVMELDLFSCCIRVAVLSGGASCMATFEAFVGVRDDKATAQVKLFGNHLQVLEQNLPMDDAYKSQDIIAAPIRVIQLIYNSGDVKGPQTVAFNLPNDERIVKDRGTSMVILKNVSEAKFKHILQPIAEACIAKEQLDYVDFDSFFTHTICHECCHGIGPHSITLPTGEKSTVRLELQELHSALEEAKADIVGLWAVKFLIVQELLPKSLIKSMYVSYLAGCFRSVRFGLEEAHGKGQALQFNWLFEKGAFTLHPDETFSVDFAKVDGEVESLSTEILTIQAKGDKKAAKALMEKYCKMSQPLKVALEKLEKIQVPVDIAPKFPIADEILRSNP